MDIANSGGGQDLNFYFLNRLIFISLASLQYSYRNQVKKIAGMTACRSTS
jgi:hypothetical protein